MLPHPVRPTVNVSTVEATTVVLVKILVVVSAPVVIAAFVPDLEAVTIKDLGEIFTSSTKSRLVRLADKS